MVDYLGELQYSPPPTSYATEVGFYGNIRPRLARSRLLSNVERIFKKHGLSVSLKSLHGDWMESMKVLLYVFEKAFV